MSLYTIYFSPTGGTKKVVEQLAKSWGEAPREIDLSDRTIRTADFSDYSFTEQDACLIAVPSFGGRVPEAALTRLAAIKGGGAKAVLVVSYGNRDYEDTLLELQDAVTACDFLVIGAVAAVAEHSIMHQFGAGRPDVADCAELSSFAEKLKQAASEAQTDATLSLPGERPFRPYGGVPMKPKASRTCTRCGLCATSCPVGAIPADEPNKTNSEICISCMRCVQICPVQARSNSKVLLFMAGQKMKKSCADRKRNELFLAD